MLCKHFRPEILCQVPLWRSLSGVSCGRDSRSLPNFHCVTVTSTHPVTPSLTHMAGRHPRPWQCSHSSKFLEKKPFVHVFHKSEQKGSEDVWLKKTSRKKSPQHSQHNNVQCFWPVLAATDWCMMQQPSYSSRRGKHIAPESWIRKGNS